MDKFVIIDGNNLMFRAFYALPPLTNFEGVDSRAVFGFTNMLVKVIKDISPRYIAVTFDISKKNFRHEKFAEYKGTRKPTPDELRGQFPIVKDMLNKMNIAVIEKEGLEADDLIGSLTREFGTHNIIVSADRDAFQLINDNTEILFPKKGITETINITKDNVKEIYGVEPNQVIDLKSLMGDSSDNIPGVAGVGEKTAIGLLEKYSTLDGVYEHIEEITGKLKEKLIASKDDAYMSKYLATIVTDRPIGKKLEEYEYLFPFSSEVMEIFKKYQFKTLLKREDLFDLTEEKESVTIDNFVVDNLDKLKNLKEDILNKKEVAVYIDDAHFNLYTDKEYVVNFGGDLFSVGLDLNVVLNELKIVFESAEISKILFDSKTLMHILDRYGIGLKGITFDCLIARYLINSLAKSGVTINDVMIECGFECESLGYAVSKIRDIYYAKMQESDLLEVFNKIEMPLVYVLFDMEKAGFKVDKDALEVLEKKYREEICEIEELIYTTAGRKFNVSSPKQLGELLFDELGLNIPSNKKKSTSIEILQEIENKHPIVPLIIRWRTITKLYNTYIVGFEGLLDKDNKIHTIFNQTLTATGRLSSSEPNLQNIPVRTEEGRALRKLFIPSKPDGFLVSADYSQIELRLLANCSGDEILINAFNNGEDIHTRTASEIFGVPVDMVDSTLRRNAKAINFGIVYGISDFGLSQNIGISRKEASNYIKMYFERYPKIEEYMQSNVNYAKENGYIKTMFGRIRPMPEINSTTHMVRTFGERVAMNMPLQGTASDIIKLAMINIYKVFKDNDLKSKIILQIHDELVVDVCPGELDIVKKLLKDGMESVVNLSVKLTVNVESGKTWYDAK